MLLFLDVVHWSYLFSCFVWQARSCADGSCWLDLCCIVMEMRWTFCDLCPSTSQTCSSLPSSCWQHLKLTRVSGGSSTSRVSDSCWGNICISVSTNWTSNNWHPADSHCCRRPGRLLHCCLSSARSLSVSFITFISSQCLLSGHNHQRGAIKYKVCRTFSPVFTERILVQLTRHLQGSQLPQAGALGKTKGGAVGFIINESLCNHVAVMRRAWSPQSSL